MHEGGGECDGTHVVRKQNRVPFPGGRETIQRGTGKEAEVKIKGPEGK